MRRAALAQTGATSCDDTGIPEDLGRNGLVGAPAVDVSTRKHEVFSRELRRLHAGRLTGFIVEPVMDATKDATVCFLLRKIREARVSTSLGGQAHSSRVDDGKRNVIPVEGNLQGARRSGRQACSVARVRLDTSAWSAAASSCLPDPSQGSDPRLRDESR